MTWGERGAMRLVAITQGKQAPRNMSGRGRWCLQGPQKVVRSFKISIE